jgi:hypothetical protein
LLQTPYRRTSQISAYTYLNSYLGIFDTRIIRILYRIWSIGLSLFCDYFANPSSILPVPVSCRFAPFSSTGSVHAFYERYQFGPGPVQFWLHRNGTTFRYQTSTETALSPKCRYKTGAEKRGKSAGKRYRQTAPNRHLRATWEWLQLVLHLIIISIIKKIIYSI